MNDGFYLSTKLNFLNPIARKIMCLTPMIMGQECPEEPQVIYAFMAGQFGNPAWKGTQENLAKSVKAAAGSKPWWASACSVRHKPAKISIARDAREGRPDVGAGR